MNKLNTALFQLIINAAGTFKNRVNDALIEYRQEMNKARKYSEQFKDEESILSGQKTLLIATAQVKIRKAQRQFASDMERYTEQLQDQLMSHVSEPIDAGFRDQLHTIAQFGLKPSRTQIMALLKQNAGNAIGIEALSKVLSDVGSPYQVKFRTVEEYERDIQKIRRLMIDPIAYDLDKDPLHHEAVEVMSDQERVFAREDGTTYKNGYHWDNTTLLSACGMFDSAVEDIEKMQDSWICDVSFQAAEAQNETDETKAELIASVVDAEPVQAEDYESSTRITDSDDNALKFAMQLGRESAREYAPMPEKVKDAYMK